MRVQENFIQYFGDPLKDRKSFEGKFMKKFAYPQLILEEIPCLGKHIYCNINFIDIYIKFLLILIHRNLHHEIKSFDGCFNPRFVRGSSNLLSIHSWGMAVDFNAKDNPLGLSREDAVKDGLTPFTSDFIKCAEDIGLVSGYNFTRKDGMHFENTKIKL